ncbi:ABC transporter substrate binding protein [Thioalkalivibrio sulfidiphilus]|nr:ABC transporter substrate binding protein [Thioalkalivibrio sulfidiphilus]
MMRTPIATWTSLIAGLMLPALVLFMPLCGFASEPQPAPKRVLLLASDDGTLHQRVLLSLERQIVNLPVSRSTAVASAESAMAQISGYDCQDCLIVTSGVNALRLGLEHSREAHILAIAIPEESFLQLTRQRTDRVRISAIYMEVSLQRMAEIISQRLTGIASVGIVSGDGQYLATEKRQGHPSEIPRMQFREYGVPREADLIEVFTQASRENQAILAVPDPRIFNRDTIVRIMLTTYRSNTPVIGYSEAMTRAGALMSVFSSPEMLGEEAGELIANALRAQRWQHTDRHTERYTVTINPQVARSLRIRVKESP